MKVIIHCSDSSFGNAATIALWHGLPKSMKGRGWSTIGYHYVILNGHMSSKAYNSFYDGHTETGRPLDDDNLIETFEYGAHVKGENHKSIGICLVGKSGIFTPRQLTSLNVLLSQLKSQFKKIEISQHSEYDNGKPFCSGLSKEYIENLNHYYRN